ncbi:MAG: ABC transporter ATP-binding protein [candidate division KSB1 bacterium]
MREIVRTTELSFSYDQTPVVREINLAIHAGDIYGFIGPNGAGKSTTIKLLLSLLTPHRGEIEIFGMSLRAQRIAILRKIGALVETPSLYPHLTGEENLEVLRRIYDVPRARIAHVLEQVGLVGQERKKVKEYSLGMKQRLGIAQTLLHEPQLLILDEPANGLDPEGMQELRFFLRRMAGEHGLTILISSHILTELEQVVNRVGIISKGRMRYEGSLEDLQRREHARLLIRVNSTEQSLAILHSASYKAKRTAEKTVAVEVEHGEDAAEVNELLVRQGVLVYHLGLEQVNLEHAFLELIKEERA